VSNRFLLLDGRFAFAIVRYDEYVDEQGESSLSPGYILGIVRVAGAQLDFVLT
jgi:hypothetical protein